MDEHTSHELAYKKGYEKGKQDAMKWIPVTKKKPKVGEYVLFMYAKNSHDPTLHAKNTMAVGRYEYKMFLVNGCEVIVTHWMPLPEPPKGE